MTDEVVATLEAPIAPTVIPLADRWQAVKQAGGKASELLATTGDLEGAEALLSPDKDLAAQTAASAPATPSEDTQVPENEAASEPAIEEQPKAGETPEQKSARKHRNDENRRMKLVREHATEKARADSLERQLADIKAASAPAAQPKTEAKADDGIDLPDMGDPKYEGEGGLAKYQTDLRIAIKSAISSQVNQALSSDKVQTSWADQVKAEKLAVNDFEAVAFSKDTPVSDAMIRHMQQHPKGAKIAYYLGKNRAEAQRITAATDIPETADPQRRAYLIGRAESRVEAEFERIAEAIAKPKTTPTKETIAQQPKPSGEVAVEANAAPAEDEETEAVKRGDQAAYNRIRMKQRRAELGI